MHYKAAMTILSGQGQGHAMTEPLYTTEKQIEQMREELEKAKKQASVQKDGRNRRKTALLFPPSKKIVSQFLFWMLIALLMVVLSTVLITRSKGEIPNLFGYELYVVESGSMSPTLKVGSVILAKKPSDAGALNINDIVTFKRIDGSIITHRIIGVLKDETGTVRYRTKGDNPVNSPDPELLDQDRVIAILVTKVPFT